MSERSLGERQAARHDPYLVFWIVYSRLSVGRLVADGGSSNAFSTAAGVAFSCTGSILAL